MGLQAWAMPSCFHMGSGGLNLGPHACLSSVLLAVHLSSSLIFFFNRDGTYRKVGKAVQDSPVASAISTQELTTFSGLLFT